MERLAQLDRQRVVVDVDVGHEEVADVAQLVADLAQPRGKLLARRDQGDPSVDEVDPAWVGDGVDVDRPEPFYRQRQRDPVHGPAQILNSTGPRRTCPPSHGSSCR